MSTMTAQACHVKENSKYTKIAIAGTKNPEIAHRHRIWNTAPILVQIILQLQPDPLTTIYRFSVLSSPYPKNVLLRTLQAVPKFIVLPSFLHPTHRLKNLNSLSTMSSHPKKTPLPKPQAVPKVIALCSHPTDPGALLKRSWTTQ